MRGSMGQSLIGIAPVVAVLGSISAVDAASLVADHNPSVVAHCRLQRDNPHTKRSSSSSWHRSRYSNDRCAARRGRAREAIDGARLASHHSRDSAHFEAPRTQSSRSALDAP